MTTITSQNDNYRVSFMEVIDVSNNRDAILISQVSL